MLVLFFRNPSLLLNTLAYRGLILHWLVVILGILIALIDYLEFLITLSLVVTWRAQHLIFTTLHLGARLLCANDFVLFYLAKGKGCSVSIIWGFLTLHFFVVLITISLHLSTSGFLSLLWSILYYFRISAKVDFLCLLILVTFQGLFLTYSIFHYQPYISILQVHKLIIRPIFIERLAQVRIAKVIVCQI
jgi:hypothetical protein